MEKKILHVVSVSFSLTYFVGEQFLYFGNLGYKFYVACSPSEHFFEYAEKMSFEPFALNIKRSISPISDVMAILRLIKYIKQNNIEIVISHTPKGGLVGILASFFAGCSHKIYFRHGLMYETSVGFKKKILKAVERITGFFSDKVICVSNSILNISNTQKLSAKHKNFILGKGTCNGISTERFCPLKFKEDELNDIKSKYQISYNDLVIGFVGRLAKDKGVHELIDSFQTLKLEDTNLKLLLVGPVDERDAISQKYLDIIQNTDEIIYIDFTENVIPFYAIMDIFILPSYREGFPTVVLEASSMELPAIVTNVTGNIDSVIDGYTGMIVDLEVEQIKLALKFYIDNESERIRHGRNGREWVMRNFDEKVVWNEIERNVFA